MKNFLILFSFLFLLGCTQQPSFEEMPKIDAHMHYGTFNTAFIEQAKADNFKLFTINTCSDDPERIQNQFDYAVQIREKYPNEIAFAATFSMVDFREPGWEQKTIQHLKKCFDAGAIAVKVWKDIGMTFRNPDSSFIMVDDPRLSPIFDFIAHENKTLITHCGEPLNCWLPLDSMTTNNDRWYFEHHPNYHMYLHPEYPSYEEQIAARDNMLAQHPDLRVVGCHLGSVEYDVDEIAKRLDQYPNFAVDTAARLSHLQVQDRQKVRDFFIKYQDRILYGTDLSARDNQADNADYAHETWVEQWRYFVSADTLSNRNVNNAYLGLDLPVTVLEKIYNKNVYKWLPGFPK